MLENLYRPLTSTSILTLGRHSNGNGRGDDCDKVRSEPVAITLSDKELRREWERIMVEALDLLEETGNSDLGYFTYIIRERRHSEDPHSSILQELLVG